MLKKLALALSLLLTPVTAQAQQSETAATELSQALIDRSKDVIALLQGSTAPEEVFGPPFIAAVPPAQFDSIAAQLTSQFGPAIAVEKIEPSGEFNAKITIRFENAIGRGTIALSPDHPHKINGLLLRQFDPIDDSIEKIIADLNALPGEVGVYYGALDGQESALEIMPDKRLAIGSTFKLYVLSALASEIAEGNLGWGDVDILKARSFPSGMMQDWPQGAPVTLHTLASLMISISDNTATDQLMARLGRKRVERELTVAGFSDPAKTTPLLTTRELFALKAGPPERLAEYRSQNNTDGMRTILEELDTEGLTTADIDAAFASGPLALDVEWLASANDLRRLFVHMRQNADPTAFDVMAINPSMPKNLQERWSYVGYKGGSEPGVLNLTWLLTDRAGQDRILTLSWNNPAASLDNSALELIAQRILALPQ